MLYELNFLPIAAERSKELLPFNRFLWCLEVKDIDTQKTAPDWVRWSYTVAANAIATTTFSVGWERQLIAIVRGFAAEIAERMSSSPQRTILLRFLECVEERVSAKQATEKEYYTTASIGMMRAGMDRDLRRMLLPGPTRDGGVPLALLPRFLRLPPSQFPWGLHRRRPAAPR